jgi:beta-phosphoglucomutase family hydrolase
MDLMTEPLAIIFDCDGTLVDSMPPHYEAWAATLAKFNLALDEDRFYALGGWPTEKVAELLIGEARLTLDARQITREKEAAFEQFIHLVEPIAPVIAIARQHHGRIPLAVATGGLRRICERLLKQAGIFELFDAIVTCEDVARHKPAPDVFLEAARRIGIDPTRCLVFEDTNPGIEAAERAGMSWIDVRTLHTPRRVVA